MPSQWATIGSTPIEGVERINAIVNRDRQEEELLYLWRIWVYGLIL